MRSKKRVRCNRAVWPRLREAGVPACWIITWIHTFGGRGGIDMTQGLFESISEIIDEELTKRKDLCEMGTHTAGDACAGCSTAALDFLVGLVANKRFVCDYTSKANTDLQPNASSWKSNSKP